MIKLIYPQNGAQVSLMTEKQKEFLSVQRGNVDTEDIDWKNLTKKDKEDDSVPKSIRFKWESDMPVKVRIWENGTSFVIDSEIDADFFEVTNFKIGTRYLWQVISENDQSEIFEFTTEDVAPRWIKVDGTTNVRDCGGWKTRDNKRVKQGLLYRGSELNSHVNITAAGLACLKNQLKIKSVMDLRGEGEEVQNTYKGNYTNIAVKPYAEYFERPQINKAIFDFLSDKNNYPIYFHCWGGADRTGAVAFILGAVLGVDIKDLMYDYELTSLSIWGNRSGKLDLFKGFMERLLTYQGENINEKAVSFVLSTGVSEKQLQNVREIFLEDAKIL